MEYRALKKNDESVAQAIEIIAKYAGLSRAKLIDIIEAGLKTKSYQIIGEIEKDDKELINALRNGVQKEKEIIKLV